MASNRPISPIVIKTSVKFCHFVRRDLEGSASGEVCRNGISRSSAEVVDEVVDDYRELPTNEVTH